MQGSLFEDEGERLKREALARVEITEFSEFVCKTIEYWPSGFLFTTDNIWPLVPDHLQPKEPRAMGAAMVRARGRGLCIETQTFVPTQRPKSHKSPQRVWQRT
jgi:hypothetical protein